ncbi:MAG: hypothetical protein ABEJ66_02060, partial [Candidatus Nanohaloarchaea archaeon]
DPGTVDDETLRYLEQSDFYTMVNPRGAREMTAYKSRTHDMLRDAGIPAIPSSDAEEAVDRGHDYALRNLGDTGHGYLLEQQPR